MPLSKILPFPIGVFRTPDVNVLQQAVQNTIKPIQDSIVGQELLDGRFLKWGDQADAFGNQYQEYFPPQAPGVSVIRLQGTQTYAFEHGLKRKYKGYLVSYLSSPGIVSAPAVVPSGKEDTSQYISLLFTTISGAAVVVFARIYVF